MDGANRFLERRSVRQDGLGSNPWWRCPDIEFIEPLNQLAHIFHELVRATVNVLADVHAARLDPGESFLQRNGLLIRFMPAVINNDVRPGNFASNFPPKLSVALI